MLGIVLCGGASSRMGHDKGLLRSDKSNWAGSMLEKLNALNIRSFLSVNKTQQDAYSQAFPNTELIVDNNTIPFKGPLAAVLNVHAIFPSEDLLITACDMPFMEFEVLNDLYRHHSNNPGKEGFVFTNEEEPEPLCAIYTSQGLSRVQKMYNDGQLFRHSMKFMLEHISVAFIPIPDNWKIYFRNMNAHADLNGL